MRRGEKKTKKRRSASCERHHEKKNNRNMYILFKMDSINSLLGPGYQVLVQGGFPVVVQKSPLENLEAFSEYNPEPLKREEPEPLKREEKDEKPQPKTMDDRIFQFYVGSLSVVGLFILFRLIQKSKR